MARIAEPRRPLRVPGAVDGAEAAAAARRAMVVRSIETGGAERALLGLGPLLERYDPTIVAAALYDLWTTAGSAPAAGTLSGGPADQPTAERAGSRPVKVFVGVGRNEGATPNDLVAVLTKEVRVPKEQIGRIEVRDNYMLVELPEWDAPRIAEALSGREIRRKRVVAKLDRGRDRAGGAKNGRERAGTGGNRRPRPKR